MPNFNKPPKARKVESNYQPTDFSLNAEKAEAPVEIIEESAPINPESRNEHRKTLAEKVRELQAHADKNKATNYRPHDFNSLDGVSPAEEKNSEAAQELRSVQQAAELAKKAGVEEERNEMNSAQAAYLEAYKKEHSKKKFPFGNKESEKLIGLKNQCEEAQLAYANKLNESVRSRLNESKEESLRKEYKKQLESMHGLRAAKGNAVSYEQYKQAEIDKIVSRYNGLIQFREIIKPALDNKNKASVEALNSREKDAGTTILKGLGWAMRKNAEVTKKMTDGYAGFFKGKLGFSDEKAQKYAKGAARVSRLFATTAAFTAAGTVTGGIGFAAAGIYAGQRLTRGLISMTAGAGAGAGAGEAYKRTGGKKVAEKLATSRRESINSLSAIRAQINAYKHGSAEAIQRKQKYLEVGTAALVSLGLSVEQAHEIANLHSMQQANEKLADAVNPNETFVESGVAKVAHAMHLPTHEGQLPAEQDMQAFAHDKAEYVIGSKHVTESQMHEFATAKTEYVIGDNHVTSQQIHQYFEPKPTIPESVSAKHGEGAYKMFRELQEKLVHNNDQSEIAQYLRSIKNPDHFMAGLAFVKHGQSALIPEGSTLSVDAHGQLVYTEHGHESILVAKNDHGEFATHTKFDEIEGHEHAYRPVHHEAVESARGDHVAPGGTPQETHAPDSDDLGTAPDPQKVYDAIHERNGLPPGSNKDPQLHDIINGQKQMHTSSILPEQLHINEHPVKHLNLDTQTKMPTYGSPLSTHSASSVVESAVAPHQTVSTGMLNQDEILSKAKGTWIEDLMHDKDWNQFRFANAQSAFKSLPETADGDALTFRTTLFNVLRQTGTAPHADESIIQYIARAEEGVHSGYVTGIVQTADNHFVAHGGDLNAQLILAREYVRENLMSHPKVLVEDHGSYVVIDEKLLKGLPSGTQPERVALTSVALASTDQPVF